MTLEIQKERYSERQQKIAKGVRTIAIFAGLTAIVAVASIGLGVF